ncbi:MAG: DUF3445 domain-containing protein, partial [Gammaproteobacteria bacterium]|nr:DUF3445 domain-containing protein [Gammaproteobacteria bacterium]
MGSSMAAIHAPVPGYQARIGTASDRLMSAVGTQRPLERENWSVLDDAALYQPSRGNVRVAGSAARRAGPGSLWFRSERQTLRRLATSGDVLFGIRIRQRPLDELCKDPRFRRTLREQIASMSPEMRRYKGLEFNLKSLLDLLEDD